MDTVTNTVTKKPELSGATNEQILRSQHAALLALARESVTGVGDEADMWRRLTETAAGVLGVERVGVWLINHDRTTIRCVDLYMSNTDTHSGGDVLRGIDFPSYFAGLSENRIIVVHDVRTDPRICELADSYLLPNGVASVLNASIAQGGKMIGVISCEHTGSRRQWYSGEQYFATSIADIAALFLEQRKRRETQDALEELATEVKMQKFALDQHAIVSVADTDGLIIYANDKFCQVSKCSRDELIGRSHSTLNSGHHTREFFKDMWDTISRGQVWNGEIKNRAKDGTCYWVETTIVPFRDTDGRIYQYVSMRTDITKIMEADEILRRTNIELQARVEEKVRELRNTQEQLLQSEKLASIGQLAAGVAHEINNPIGYIGSNLASLKNYLGDLLKMLEMYETSETALARDPVLFEKLQGLKTELDLTYLKDDVQELVDESQEGVMRVKKIVQDLKDFSHVDEAEWQWADLHKGLDSTLNIVWNELKYKAEVAKEYGDLPQVECVPSQLNQVFMNLLVNAGHAIAERGVITIRTGTDGADWVWLEIADTGQGIAEEHRKRIFDPFFTTKPVGKGTGLGLSLSYGIINKHGGQIEVHSEVGKGTVFRVRLPVKPGEFSESERVVAELSNAQGRSPSV